MDFGSCGTWAQPLRLLGFTAQTPHVWYVGLVAVQTWDRPGSGIKPVSLTLIGVFVTTETPGKPNPRFS